MGSNFETGENYRVQEKITTLNNKVVKNYYYMDKKYLYIEETQIQDKNYNYIIFHNLDTNEYSEFIINENGELIKLLLAAESTVNIKSCSCSEISLFLLLFAKYV